jgi:catechol 2,3-dioxygenase-like lactoylglutathione lyase family enzyme
MAAIRFDHIAIAHAQVGDVVPFIVGVLGGVPDYGAPAGPYRFFQWRFTGGGRLEVVEPLGPDGFLHRFLATRGPGIHHVTFMVPSLRAVCERARDRGYQIVGYDDSRAHWKEAFLHPKQALGIVVQFAEASGGGGTRRWQPPPGPDRPPPPPVRVLGLRMRAHSRERADRQWCDLLGAELTPGTGGTLVYRWAGSPMHIAVEIDPGRDEGPIAIEVAADRALELTRAKPPGGVRFSQV